MHGTPRATAAERILPSSVRAPLPLGESVIIAWPQMVGMFASMIIVFVIGYVIFQRQEVRA